MQSVVLVKDGESAYIEFDATDGAADRWGDYSYVHVDPNDMLLSRILDPKIGGQSAGTFGRKVFEFTDANWGGPGVAFARARWGSLTSWEENVPWFGAQL